LQTISKSAKIAIRQQIGETSATKFSFSAIMTPFVTQKRGIFAAISAKTALANYLL
jgi:hypothetical protein